MLIRITLICTALVYRFSIYSPVGGGLIFKNTFTIAECKELNSNPFLPMETHAHLFKQFQFVAGTYF